MQITEAHSADGNGFQKLDSIVQDSSSQHVALTIFPEQIGTFWELLRETIIDSISTEVDVSENLLLKWQYMLMSGKLNAVLFVKRGETPVVEGALIFVVLYDEIVELTYATVYAFKVFNALSLRGWRNHITSFIRIMRNAGAKQIRLVVSDDKEKLLLRNEGFDISRNLCVLNIGA